VTSCEGDYRDSLNVHPRAPREHTRLAKGLRTVASSQHPAEPRESEEARRSRKAAELALQQLEWCIGYLRRIRKHEIAKALERNRASIIERYRL
jgi:hypothetical protein